MPKILFIIKELNILRFCWVKLDRITLILSLDGKIIEFYRNYWLEELKNVLGISEGSDTLIKLYLMKVILRNNLC